MVIFIFYGALLCFGKCVVNCLRILTESYIYLCSQRRNKVSVVSIFQTWESKISERWWLISSRVDIRV